MKKFILMLTSFYLALVLLMPKVELFWALKQFLQTQKVELHEKSIKDRWFDLKIEDATLFYDGIESASIASIEVWPWLFYNQIKAVDLKAGKDIRKMFNFTANKLTIRHSVVSPFRIEIAAEGNFGTLSGGIDLKQQKIKLLCKPTPSFKRSQAFREFFRKSKEGYVYESIL